MAKNTVPFVNHHVHSHFSKLDGLSKPKDIVERVVEMGQSSISITDHGFMSGIPQMYKEAKDAGIGFTPGIEAYFAKDRTYKHEDRNGESYYHLLMLATSDEGYKNLVKMQTPAWEEGFYRHPRIDYEVMDTYSKDIVVTTSCLSGIVSRLLLKGDYQGARKEIATLIDIFGKENVFVEIQRHGIDDQEKILGDLVKLSKEFSLPLLATADSHYTREEDCDVHDTLLCCSAGGDKFAPAGKRFKFDSTKNFLHTGEQMMELFPEEDFPGAVTNTYDLALRTQESGFSLPMNENKYILPSVPVEEGQTEIETLRSKVYEGAKKVDRYGDENGDISAEVKERIEYELDVIENMGFPGYFLIVANYVQLFKDNGIVVGHGRGCVDGKTEVLTERGWKYIKDVNEGDFVIDSLGKMSKVLQRHKYPTQEDEQLYVLTDDRGEKLTLTGKHKVLSMNDKGEREWIQASRVRPGRSILHVTGSRSRQFQYFDGEKHGREDDSLRRRVIKDSAWGYVCAMLVIHADIKENGTCASWDFSDDTVLASETLLSLIENVFPNKSKVKRRKDGVIKKIEFRDREVNLWAVSQRKEKNAFVGVGMKEYAFGFIQAMQTTFSSPVCVSNIIEVDTKDNVEILCNSLRSAGIEFNVSDTTVFLESLRSYGVNKFTSVVDVSTTPSGSRDVYDLTIEGNPSFLTKFGTIHNSAPGSVVVYCLGITNIDPFRHKLHFERFLNPDRISMPDIDIDIPKTKRGRALELLEEEYGHGHVAQISNYSAMKTKDALERVAKAYGMTPKEAGFLKKSVDEYCELNEVSLFDIVDDRSIPREILTSVSGNDYIPDILSDAAKIDGTISAYSTHACGIVITTKRVDEYFPVRFNTKKGEPVGLPICQYDGHDVEALGGVKMDLLGLTNLDQASDAQRNIRLDLGVDIDPFNLPLDDIETYELLSRGSGGDVFQLGCLAGDTIVDGKKISHWYQLRHSTQRASFLRSVYMGEGHIHNNRVIDVVYSGEKETLTLYSGKRKLQCTPEHRIFTLSGWKKAGDISVGEKILHVSDSIDGRRYYQTLRGRRDILDVYASMHPEWEEIERFVPISTGSSAFYPNFHKYGSLDELVLIYPDENRYDALKSCEEFSSQEGRKVIARSYSEVIEELYSLGKIDDDYLTPFGSEFIAVENIEKSGVVKTYDIMMQSPVNNFIANGIMVHNSSGMKELMKKMQPNSFEDLSALIALYRPGPIDQKAHEEYARRKNAENSENYDVFHEDARDLLADSYGLCIYQEDIMGISKKFADYTGGEADALRKAIGKKIPEMMQEQEKKFIPAVDERYYDGLGKEIWEIIEPFGKYAFNRSHSAAYASLSYLTAWLKAHYTAQFAGACIDYNITDKTKILDTMRWVREEGVEILPPNINLSQTRTVTSKDSVTLPLDIINGIGQSQAQEFISHRDKDGEYLSVVDFLARNKVSEKTLVLLAKSGTFDCFGVSRASVVLHADELIAEASMMKTRNEFLEDSLFGDIIDDGASKDSSVDLSKKVETIYEDGNTVTVDEDLYARWERESIGFIIGPHPFGSIRKLNSSKMLFGKYPPVDTISKVTKGKDDDNFCGIISHITNKRTQRGDPFSKFDLETENGSVPCIIFKKHVREEWEGCCVAVEGRVANEAESEYYKSRHEDDEGEDLFLPIIKCSKVKRIKVEKLKARG